MNLDKYRVKPGSEIKLSQVNTRPGKHVPGKKKLDVSVQSDTEEIAKLQYKLYAENRQSLLIILQGMDSSGKDGTITHIMSGLNPQQGIGGI